MSRDPHPTLTAALSGLRRATAFAETVPSAEDLADRLATLHDLTGPCLLAHLHELLYRLANTTSALPLPAEARTLIADHLNDASVLLGPVGDAIDKAREATGAWTR